MEWLIVAAAFMLFFIVPPCLIYDSIMHPEQFGPPGPDGHYNLEAEKAKAAINRFYANLVRAICRLRFADSGGNHR
jgi:hypothetical protein